MLYNPSWTPGTLGHLVSWLETRDPNEKYMYINGINCLLSQYYRSIGYSFRYIDTYHINGYGATYMERARNRKELPKHFNDIALKGRHTFGAALERARGYLAHQ